MTVVKCGSKAWALRKADEDVFQRNYLRIVLGTLLTDRISKSRLYEKCDSISLFKVIMKEGSRWQGHVLRMKYDRLSFSANRLRLKGQQVVIVCGGRMS